jgi:hypothetical protein
MLTGSYHIAFFARRNGSSNLQRRSRPGQGNTPKEHAPGRSRELLLAPFHHRAIENRAAKGRLDETAARKKTGEPETRSPAKIGATGAGN